MARGTKHDSIMPLVYIGGALGLGYILINKFGSGNMNPMQDNGGAFDSPGYGGTLNPVANDMTIDSVGQKATILDKIQAGRELLDTVNDAALKINLPSGGILRIFKGKKKTEQTPDNFNIDREDAREAIDVLQTGNPVKIANTLSKIAVKNGKKRPVGKRAVKRIATIKKTAAKKKPVRRAAAPKRRTTVRVKHF